MFEESSFTWKSSSRNNVLPSTLPPYHVALEVEKESWIDRDSFLVHLLFIKDSIILFYVVDKKNLLY